MTWSDKAAGVGREAAARADSWAHRKGGRPLAWPAAALVILSLSVLLWLGLGVVFASLR